MHNATNRRFYEVVPDDFIFQSGMIAGIIPPVDVEIALSHINVDPSSDFSALEVGAGEGRVVDALLAHCRRVNVLAVEQCSRLATALQGKYTNHSRATILHGDINSVELAPVDISFWMFTGIADFAPDEQEGVLKRLAGNTQKTIVIETPAENTETIASDRKGQWYTFKNKWGGCDWKGYIPSRTEMSAFANNLGLRYRCVPYFSATHRARELHFLDR